MRLVIAFLTVSFLATAGAYAQPADAAYADQATQMTAPADELLQRGQNNYRAGHYAEAAKDLRAASEAWLTPDQMRTYVNTGKFASLPKFETAVVYLAMAYAKLGRDSEASEQIHRLHAAEAIQPTYAKLPLTAEVADFEEVAARVAPNSNLPRNAALAALRSGKRPTARVAEAKPAPAPAPPEPAPPAAQPKPAAAEERTASDRIVAERVAAERAAIERNTAERIAAVQQEAERSIEERIAHDRAALQKAAQEQIAAAEAAARREADAKVAAAKAEAEKEAEARVAAATAAAKERADEEAAQRIAEIRAATGRAAEERIATARAEAEQSVEERVAAERAARAKRSEKRTAAPRTPAAVAKGSESSLLRQADALAAGGDFDRANAIYVRLINRPNASREAITAAATGLYRTSDFADAVTAFQRLSSFARGEEDLRYYNAVALYETGHYEEAKKELACALPYLQPTEDIVRYREKIEQTASRLP